MKRIVLVIIGLFCISAGILIGLGELSEVAIVLLGIMIISFLTLYVITGILLSKNREQEEEIGLHKKQVTYP